MTFDILRTCTPQSPALLSPARLLAILTFRLAVNDSPFSSLSRWPSPLSRVLCTVLRKLKSMSTVEDFMSRLGMYFAGSRMPEHDARTLWVMRYGQSRREDDIVLAIYGIYIANLLSHDNSPRRKKLTRPRVPEAIDRE